MSKDKELLEMAAKAAGIVLWPDDAWRDSIAVGLLLENGFSIWNPLLDKADCLQMEINLKAHSLFDVVSNKWQVIIGGRIGIDEDRQRAATIAAAEIGRLM